MAFEVEITARPREADDEKIIRLKISRALEKRGVKMPARSLSYSLVKKSIDSRRGSSKIFMRFLVGAEGEAAPSLARGVPEWKEADGKRSVVIVGSGPAGLFGALRLLEDGIKPVIVERGADTSRRKRDIARISVDGIVDRDSNYCFGEGGAGTFSDGKLYTRSGARGDAGKISRVLNYFGAPEKILTDARPHIGTDRLPRIVNAMREKIVSLGGEFLFDSRCSGILLEERDGKKIARGARIQDTKTGEAREITGDAVMLATGHSASDIYKIIHDAAPLALEPKGFAVGVRVEHPRALIDSIQYHGQEKICALPASSYRLSAQADGRGVYSFCVCPGGFIVPAATAPDEIVVNGMSSSSRASAWTNSAIVTQIFPEDIFNLYRFKKDGGDDGRLAPLAWRASLERAAFAHGCGQKAPAQRMVDFLARRASDSLPRSSYAPGVEPSRLDEWLPEGIARRLASAFRQFDRKMNGFVCDDALLVAVETRTSSALRILRDEKTLECAFMARLYPAGEGSGYSGGIVSSAMDGEKVCTAISSKLFGQK